MAEGSSEKMSSKTTEDEPFKTVPVRRKRKRGQVEDMDTSEELKRPSFPPAKAEKLMVSVICFGVSCTMNASSSALHIVDPLFYRVESQRCEKYLFLLTDTHLLKKTG